MEFGATHTFVLDELITNTYVPEDISVGHQLMRDGEDIRGVLEHAS